MIFMITIILTILVVLNFILLKFSCNKTRQRKLSSKPFVIRKQRTPTITTQPATTQLAATGS